MTARVARTLSSLLAVVLAAACTNYFEIPIETPIQAKLDVTPFQRVLIAGFVSGGTDDVDANLETVRLLRSQLRTKSALRVIEADVLPLAELASDKAKAAASSGGGPSASGETSANGNLPKVAADVQTMAPPAPQAPATSSNTEAAKIRNAKDLEKYQSIFADVAFWKKIGEEYENPLIVTGTVLFTPQQTAGFVTRNVEQYDQLGRRTVVPQRLYMERKGFAITPKFIFIDGRTGATLHTESLHEEILYSSQQNTPALSSYFELMDKVIPVFLGTLSTQKIRGTRVLLR